MFVPPAGATYPELETLHAEASNTGIFPLEPSPQ